MARFTGGTTNFTQQEDGSHLVEFEKIKLHV
jgi:hypothetical protein